VLSAGHGSMLLYALLHLAQVEAVDKAGHPQGRPAVSLDDIKNFRELGGVCAGHPEYGLTTGVETTTGPLGQGAGTSVGMAIAQRWLAERFNRPGQTLFDYNVYTLCSDGDMMEGVASEAASIAGHLRLSNLCWIYDDNNVTIEGHTELAFDENVAERFRGYGWATREVDDANDCESFARAVESFQAQGDRPTLIVVRSVIGYGSPHKQGTSKAHSDPLGEEEVKLTKDAYGWPRDAKFLVPEGVSDRLADAMRERGGKAREAWRESFKAYREKHADLAAELIAMRHRTLPDGWDADIPTFGADAKGMATREASGKVLNAIAPKLPWLVGGSADLAPSTKTRLDFAEAGDFEPRSYAGRNFHFGVREHAMGAIANGLSISHLRPYTGTFLIFSDYMRPPIRLAALMETPVVFVFSHDSISLGQDGPTHQPIEQLANLRAVPNLTVLRPGDANETAVAWQIALETKTRPVVLVLSRQAVPTLDRNLYASAQGVRHGAYVLKDAVNGDPKLILIASGSEVELIVAAAARLEVEGIAVRCVSMPSWELFDALPVDDRDAVLPPSVHARLAVEAGATQGWHRYVGDAGDVIGVDRFGASAPGKTVLRGFGFTVDNVCLRARALLP